MINVKEKTNEFRDNQIKQLENTTSTISETTNNINENINEYQRTNNKIFEKSFELADKYQQQIVNTIKAISNNYIEAQKNFLYNYQPAFSRFLDDTYYKSKSNWNKFRFSERYNDIYNKTNETITDNTINCTQRLNDFALTSTESFNKSIEIAQKCYNESVQNYLNYVNKVGRSYSNQ